uniref:Uncharacterized protein n=1 Tax=Chromera velia CCMP2878 TaxID=1169474 RepID=A0A0G4HEV3_9ALVE|eukprot:Cvel_6597.t1-p1 / transcript=Cvel_6597.t1 / gene=Cvel_6597 / organism=Chromera_velia_CCMP2878 / gene_product=Uncharacterized protein CG42266, putative / transcript_product=Uncharacterized protein CG42266, putative / location=Cvel_scaffold326:32113-33591(+) / protein_length=435 / sequence_SO=supercontig / SO=protein_coding / is_pseudo=false
MRQGGGANRGGGVGPRYQLTAQSSPHPITGETQWTIADAPPYPPPGASSSSSASGGAVTGRYVPKAAVDGLLDSVRNRLDLLQIKVDDVDARTERSLEDLQQARGGDRAGERQEPPPVPPGFVQGLSPVQIPPRQQSGPPSRFPHSEGPERAQAQMGGRVSHTQTQTPIQPQLPSRPLSRQQEDLLSPSRTPSYPAPGRSRIGPPLQPPPSYVPVPQHDYAGEARTDRREVRFPGPGGVPYPGPGGVPYPGPGDVRCPGPGEARYPGPGEARYPGPGETRYPDVGDIRYPGPVEARYLDPGEVSYPDPREPGGYPDPPGEIRYADPGDVRLLSEQPGERERERERRIRPFLHHNAPPPSWRGFPPPSGLGSSSASRSAWGEGGSQQGYPGEERKPVVSQQQTLIMPSLPRDGHTQPPFPPPSYPPDYPPPHYNDP